MIYVNRVISLEVIEKLFVNRSELVLHCFLLPVAVALISTCSFCLHGILPVWDSMERFHVCIPFFYLFQTRRKQIQILAWRKTICRDKNQPCVSNSVEAQNNVLRACSWAKVKWQAETHTAGWILWTNISRVSTVFKAVCKLQTQNHTECLSLK